MSRYEYSTNHFTKFSPAILAVSQSVRRLLLKMARELELIAHNTEATDEGNKGAYTNLSARFCSNTTMDCHFCVL
jgi:hypothetical protein